MSTTTTTKHLLQYPFHHHPLELLDLNNETRTLRCDLCHRKIWSEAYTCQEGCNSDNYYHKVCVEAPPRIESHPLHPVHPLPLIQQQQTFRCDACNENFYSGDSSFRCDECDFDLDTCCALSTLSDVGVYRGGKTSEQITLPFHPHPLTSFSTKHNFVGDSDCHICRKSVEGDGYMCLRQRCEFIIHKRCIQDLYYADGTKAPRVYHGHPLEIFLWEDTGSSSCASCGSDKSGEFIGCACCQVFYHRHCFQVPEILRYPSHNPNHTLVLFPDIGTQRQCESCSSSLEDEIYYRCTSCEFFVHVGCAFQVLSYCEEGMSAKIELSWHKHPLLLCHRTESSSNSCRYCEEQPIGPTYECEEMFCGFLLHKRCTEIQSTITHPHHPDHPITLCQSDDDDDDDDDLSYDCDACGEPVDDLKFSCKLCLVDLHVECAARFPTHKHYLHEHDLVKFDEISSAECKRCRTADDSPIFRCVPCKFNLHEKCMELPPVVKHETHFHPLTLRDFFMEDDTGEYYCDLCEKRRDGRLGVYVCGQCELTMDRPWAFHIECVLPELRQVYVKEDNTIAMERLADEITRREEQVRATESKLDKMRRELEKMRKKESKLDEMKRQLEELRKKHAAMAVE